MIERYTRPEMAAIWTVEKRYQTWLKVEILATVSRMGAVKRNPSFNAGFV